MEAQDVKRELIRAAQNEADYRRRTQARYSDSQSGRAANGLEELVIFIRRLPESDARLLTWSKYGEWRGGRLWLPAEVKRFLSTFRYKSATEDAGGFLSRLTAALVEEQTGVI